MLRLSDKNGEYSQCWVANGERLNSNVKWGQKGKRALGLENASWVREELESTTTANLREEQMRCSNVSSCNNE